MNTIHGIILTESSGLGSGLRPYGAYCVANELRSNGYNILVINYISHINHSILELILRKYITESTLFLGYSSSLFISSFFKNDVSPLSNDSFEKLNALAKELNPKIQVIYGGANSKRLSTYNLRHNTSLGVDYVMHGFSEKMIVDFVKNLQTGSIQNVSKKVLRLSEIDYDFKGTLFDFHNSRHHWANEDIIGTNEALPLEVARGCIFKCKFCAFPLLGKNPNDSSYFKKEENLKREMLENYERFQTKTYFIVDDTFNERTEKIEMMLRIRDSLKIDFNFVGYNRLDLIARKKEHLPLLKDLNFNGMYFGIESMHLPSAKSIGKGLGPEEIKENIFKIKDYFPSCSITGSFIVGLPYETPETFESWIKWVTDKDCPIDSLNFGPLGLMYNSFTPSEFSKDPEKYGYTLVGNLGAWKNQYWTSEECRNIAEQLTKTCHDNGRTKVPSFVAVNLLKLGYDFNSIIKMSLKDIPVNDIDSKMKNFVMSYTQKILNLSNKK